MSWQKLSLGSSVFLAGVTIAAFLSGWWVLTAIPIGFLFGFFLERADLCGASAFSEVVLTRDARKLGGIWILIAVSMLTFAAGSSLGWISLNPKPLIWANYLVGGVLFGAGMVLAGGCVSGTLFKAGQGNLNSMAALVSIPIGVAAVETGPAKGLLRYLKGSVIPNSEGGAVTLTSLTGLSYATLAVVFAALTLAVVLLLRHYKAAEEPAAMESNASPLAQRILTRPWKPWQSGVAIGLLALAAYASSAASGRNYPLGVTHGVLHVELLATDYPVRHVWEPKPEPTAPAAEPAGQVGLQRPRPAKKVVWWLVGLVTFLVVGSHVSARLRGSFRLLPKPPDETIVAFLGGLMVGSGAALATGCVVGNIMSGVALMSVGNLLFAVVVALANWATTYLYLLGRSELSSMTRRVDSGEV
jgi:uncharacterized membrane protein YedE/YeeE